MLSRELHPILDRHVINICMPVSCGLCVGLEIIKIIIIVVSAINNDFSSQPKGSPFLLFPPHSRVILLSEAFFAPQGRFLRLSRGTFYCIRNLSGCGRPKARGQVRARPHKLSLPW